VPQRLLLICCTLELLALAIWVGGLVVIIVVVIPAVFNSFGMEAGGRFLTRTFDGYNRTTVGALVVMLSCSLMRLWLGRRPGSHAESPTRIETVVLLSMGVGVFLIVVVLGPQTAGLQEQAFGVKEEAAKKAAYDAFFRWHMLVRGMYLINLTLGVILMGIKLRKWRGGA
jgi:uncharacterized membrane protein